MKEDLLKEGTSLAKETIDDFKNDIKERIKLPLLISYGVILVIYNWDVLYYLIFKDEESFAKIQFIKVEFANPDHTRFTTPFLLAILTTFMFPAVQVLINFVFNVFKKINNKLTTDEEIDKANRDKKLIDIRSGNFDKEILQAQIETNNQVIADLKKDNLLISENYAKINKDKLLLDQLARKNEINRNDAAFIVKDILSGIQNKEYRESVFTYMNFLKDYEELNQNGKDFLKMIIEFLTVEDSVGLEEIPEITENHGVNLHPTLINALLGKLLDLNLIVSIKNETNDSLFTLTEKGKQIDNFIKSFNF